MRFSEIKPRLEELIVFNVHDLCLIDPNFRHATLYDWLKQGRILKLRRNHYVLSEFKPWGFDLYLLSNRIYQPSYVSLELALNHYGIIPESVVLLTAVSTLKTQSFTNTFGNFQYQSISKALFFGYQNIDHRDRSVQLATFEKSILDYLYLNPQIAGIQDFAELRWNRETLNEKLDWDRLMSYLAIFNNKTLAKKVIVLKNYLEGLND